MRALRFHTARDLRLEDIAAPPRSLKPDELLLRSVTCGICGTDLHEYKAGPKITTEHPQILGHEVVGVVLAAGDEVSSAKVGERVSVMPQIYCGRCPACLAGRQQLCAHLGGLGVNARWGAFADELVVSDQQVSVLPDTVDDITGAIVEPAAVALRAVESAPVRPGDAVLVCGGGAIGQLAALAARVAGASWVIVSEPRAARRRCAGGLGFTTFGPAGGDGSDFVRDLTGELGADVAIECSGNARALNGAIAALRPAGTAIEVAAAFDPLEVDMLSLVVKAITLRGSFCYPIDCWPRVIRMIADGALPVGGIVTSTIPLEDAVERGFKELIDDRSDQVKVVVRISD